MARLATGQVIVTPSKTGGPTSYAIRFRAEGQRRYETLGYAPDWTPERAERELRYRLDQVRRGEYEPPASKRPDQAPARRAEDPTFHVFASEWFERSRHEWKPATVRAYRDELTLHLLPHFAKFRLSEITVEEVDRFRAQKLRARREWDAAAARRRPKTRQPVGPATINKTLTRLGQVLEQAVEYGYIDRNPARGKRRRIKHAPPPRSYLDRAEQFDALLAAAGELDQHARDDRRHVGRRAIVATLMFGGLRIGELLELRWRDVDLANGRLRVGERDGGAADAKTAAGIRTVDLLPVLRDELATWKASAARTRPDDYVFATRNGTRPSKDNIRNRVLTPAIKRADTALEAADRTPLPPRLTPHGLRHSFASLLVALGDDPRYVMDQIGHTDPAFTLRLYTHAMRRDDGDLERLRELVGRPGGGVTAAQGRLAGVL